MDSFFRLAAQSRKYRLIRLWYGSPVLSAKALKYSIVSGSRRIVMVLFKNLA
jgi:hypothetical protein